MQIGIACHIFDSQADLVTIIMTQTIISVSVSAVIISSDPSSEAWHFFVRYKNHALSIIRICQEIFSEKKIKTFSENFYFRQ